MLSSIAAVFLSTFPVWGATIKAASYKDDQQGFLSTFPVWGATYTALRCLRCTSISIHVPRVGSDPLPPAVWPAVQLFLSTFPVWGATGKLSALCAHSLYFYPRSPCGERPAVEPIALTDDSYFYPRSPCGERLRFHIYCNRPANISIHVPRVGSDGSGSSRRPSNGHFYPRSPCGERRCAECGRC